MDLYKSVSQLSYRPPTARQVGVNYLGIGLVLGFISISLVLMGLSILIQGLSLGLASALVGLVGAFLPAPFYLLLWLWLDRNDPEPEWAILLVYAWGGGVAIFLALIVNTLVHVIAAVVASDETAKVVVTVFCAPVIEELAKGSAVIGVYLFMRHEMGTVVDGILYAGVVALGFATVENAGYYGKAYSDGQFSGFLITFFLRGVLSPFSHAFYTSMTGLGCGLARETRRPLLRWLLPILGLLAAMFFHALWNGVAVIADHTSPLVFLIAYVVVWLPLFLAFFAVAIWLGFREGRIIREMLAHEVSRGRLAELDVLRTCSVFKRLPWLLEVLTDPPRLQRRRRYLRLATQLGLCLWHVRNATQAGGNTMSFDQAPRIRQELAELRPAL